MFGRRATKSLRREREVYATRGTFRGRERRFAGRATLGPLTTNIPRRGECRDPNWRTRLAVNGRRSSTDRSPRNREWGSVQTSTPQPTGPDVGDDAIVHWRRPVPPTPAIPRTRHSSGTRSVYTTGLLCRVCPVGRCEPSRQCPRIRGTDTGSRSSSRVPPGHS